MAKTAARGPATPKVTPRAVAALEVWLGVAPEEVAGVPEEVGLTVLVAVVVVETEWVKD